MSPPWIAHMSPGLGVHVTLPRARVRRVRGSPGSAFECFDLPTRTDGEARKRRGPWSTHGEDILDEALEKPQVSRFPVGKSKHSKADRRANWTVSRAFKDAELGRAATLAPTARWSRATRACACGCTRARVRVGPRKIVAYLKVGAGPRPELHLRRLKRTDPPERPRSPAGGVDKRRLVRGREQTGNAVYVALWRKARLSHDRGAGDPPWDMGDPERSNMPPGLGVHVTLPRARA